MNGTSRAGLLRFAARAGSVVSLVFFALVLTSGGAAPQGSEWVGLAFFPITVTAGLLLGWRAPLAGGLLACVGLAGFYASHLIDSGRWPTGPWFAALTLPALLFIASAPRERRKSE